MIVAFVGVQGLGQTFMDWSFHYLTGQDTYWHHEKDSIPLVTDPTTTENAHRHLKNHPCGLEETEDFLSMARISNQPLITFYPFIDGTIEGPNTVKAYGQLIDLLVEADVKIFSINLTKRYPYFFTRNELDDDETLRALQRWLESENVSFVRDDFRSIREKLSLKIIGNRRKWLDNLQEFYTETGPLMKHSFTDDEWTNQPMECMEIILKKVSMNMSDHRIDQWIRIAGRWKSFHQKIVRWYEKDLNEITENIIQGNSMSLDRLHLGIKEQASIMAHLMADHGRRLLLPSEDFPKNTKDLHRFLK